MSKLLLSPRAGKAGFTLMELLVVLVIMGFLLGMIVPRLGGVADSAVDTVCDSNNKGVRYYTKVFLDGKGRLPNKLTNLVAYDLGSGAYVANYDDDATEYSFSDNSTVRMMSDFDASNGADLFAPDFIQRNGVVLHTLNDEEAKELRSLGITSVLNLRGQNRPMETTSVNASMPVAMCGDVTTTNLTDFPPGNPFWFGRILLGVGETSELVTGGYIQAAALCPGGIQQQDNVSFNNYVLVAPRLAETVERMDASIADQTLYALADGSANGEVREFTVSAQEKWEFDFSCPEGHKWPDADNDTWVVQATAP